MADARHVIWIACLSCLVMTGCCTVCRNAYRTVVGEPLQYSWKLDTHRSLALYRQWAEQAWREESQGCSELATYPEYAIGFQDGFVDYVYAGGNGEPPPLPPRKLWNVSLRGPDGRERAAQWFEGYRHGARVAQIGGYRSFGTVQSSVVGFLSARDGLGFGNETEPVEPADDEPLPAPEERSSPVLRKGEVEGGGDADASPRNDEVLRADDIPLEPAEQSSTTEDGDAAISTGENASLKLVEIVRLSAIPRKRLMVQLSSSSVAAAQPAPREPRGLEALAGNALPDASRSQKAAHQATRRAAVQQNAPLSRENSPSSESRRPR